MLMIIIGTIDITICLFKQETRFIKNNPAGSVGGDDVDKNQNWCSQIARPLELQRPYSLLLAQSVFWLTFKLLSFDWPKMGHLPVRGR